MADTPRLNMPYPDFRETNWNDSFQAFADAVDANVFAVREEQNVLVRGGGSVEMNTTTDVFSWSGDVLITSPTHAQTITLLAAAIAINDGEFWAIKTPKGPAGSVEIASEALTSVDPSQGYKVLGYRSGDDMVLFNGKVIPADTVVDSGLEIIPSSTAGEAVEYSTIVELLNGVGSLGDGTIAFVQWMPSAYIPGDTGRFSTEVRGGQVQNDPFNQLIPPEAWFDSIGAGGWQVGAGDVADITFNGNGSISLGWDSGSATNPYWDGGSDWGFLGLTSIYLDQPILQAEGVSALFAGYSDADSGSAVVGVALNKEGAPSVGENVFTFVELASGSGRVVVGSEYDSTNAYADQTIDNHPFAGATGGSLRLSAKLGNATYGTGRVEGAATFLDATDATVATDSTATTGIPAQLQTDLGPVGVENLNLHIFVGGDSGDSPNPSVTIHAIGRLTKQPWGSQMGGGGGFAEGIPTRVAFTDIPDLIAKATSGEHEVGTQFYASYTPTPFAWDSGQLVHTLVAQSVDHEEALSPKIGSSFVPAELMGTWASADYGGPLVVSEDGAGASYLDMSLVGSEADNSTYLNPTQWAGRLKSRCAFFGDRRPDIVGIEVYLEQMSFPSADHHVVCGQIADPATTPRFWTSVLRAGAYTSLYIQEDGGNQSAFNNTPDANQTTPNYLRLSYEGSPVDNNGVQIGFGLRGEPSSGNEADGNYSGWVDAPISVAADVFSGFDQTGDRLTQPFVITTGGGVALTCKVYGVRFIRRGQIGTDASIPSRVSFTDIPDLISKATSGDYVVGTQFYCNYTPTPISTDTGQMVFTLERQSTDPNVALSPKIGEQMIPIALMGSWLSQVYGTATSVDSDGGLIVTASGADAQDFTYLNFAGWNGFAYGKAWNFGEPIAGIEELQLFLSRPTFAGNAGVKPLVATNPALDPQISFSELYNASGIRSDTQSPAANNGSFAASPVDSDYVRLACQARAVSDKTQASCWGELQGLPSTGVTVDADNAVTTAELLSVVVGTAEIYESVSWDRVLLGDRPVQPAMVALSDAGGSVSTKLYGVRFKYKSGEVIKGTPTRVVFTDIPDLISKATSGDYVVGTVFYAHYTTPVGSGVLEHHLKAQSSDPNRALSPKILEPPTPVKLLGSYLNTDAGGPSVFNSDGSLIMDLVGGEGSVSTYSKYTNNFGRVWSFGDGLIGARGVNLWVSNPGGSSMASSVVVTTGLRVLPATPAWFVGTRTQQVGIIPTRQTSSAFASGSTTTHDADSNNPAYGILRAWNRLFDNTGTWLAQYGGWEGAASAGAASDADLSRYQTVYSGNFSTYQEPFEQANIDAGTHPTVPFVMVTSDGAQTLECDLHLVQVEYSTSPLSQANSVAIEYDTIGAAIRDAPDGSIARITQAANAAENIHAIDFTSPISGGVFEHNPFVHPWSIGKIDSTFAAPGSSSSILWYHAADATPFTINGDGTCQVDYSDAKKSAHFDSSGVGGVGFEINYPIPYFAGSECVIKEFVAAPGSSIYGYRHGMTRVNTAERWGGASYGEGTAITNGAANAQGRYPALWNGFIGTISHVGIAQRQQHFFTNNPAIAASHQVQLENDLGGTANVSVTPNATYVTDWESGEDFNLFFTLYNDTAVSFSMVVQTIGVSRQKMPASGGSTPSPP